MKTLTQFAGASPFAMFAAKADTPAAAPTLKSVKAKPAAKKERKPHAPAHFVDMAVLQVTSDPLPQIKRNPVYKYDLLFAGMKPGQCIKCPSKYVQRMQHALVTWIKRRGKWEELHVRSIKRYEDTDEGRVWLLTREKK